MARFYRAADYLRAVEMLDAGRTVSETARAIDVPRTTLDKWVKWRREGRIEVSDGKVIFDGEVVVCGQPDPDAKDLRIAALETQLAEVAMATAPDRAPVTGHEMRPIPAGELWALAEEHNARYIQRAEKQHNFEATFANGPIGISFVSDQHICARNAVDLRQMRLDAELIRDTAGLYAVLGGDGVDNHIKHRAAMLAAKSTPDEQFELYEYYLQIFAPKILVMISGNHDDWTGDMAGIDMIRKIAAANHLHSAPDEARISVSVGQQRYEIVVRHQFRMNSSFNLCHAVKQLWRMGEASFDIGCVGHHHEPSIESFDAHGQKRWACRPGSYQITSAYSRRYGFNRTRPTCPTFVLFPGERRIVGFDDLRDGAEFLTQKRKALM